MVRQPNPAAATSSRNPVGCCDLWISGKHLLNRIIGDVSRGTFTWLAQPTSAAATANWNLGWSLGVVDVRQAPPQPRHRRCFTWNISGLATSIGRHDGGLESRLIQ
jgi:hypothetical protein